MHLNRSRWQFESGIPGTPGTTIYSIDGWLLISQTRYFISHMGDLFQQNKAMRLALHDPAAPAPRAGQIDHSDIPAQERGSIPQE